MTNVIDFRDYAAKRGDKRNDKPTLQEATEVIVFPGVRFEYQETSGGDASRVSGKR